MRPPQLPRPLAAWPVMAAVALAGCASVAPLPLRDASGSVESAPLDLDGQVVEATWYWPATAPRLLLVMQHGFARRCHHLRETTRQLAAVPAVALCVDAPMAGGNAALADALAARLAGDLRGPGDRALPKPIVVGGHSAGAVFALHVGAGLHRLAPQRLAGALLFDPVATASFETDLRRVADAGRRPMLVLLAPPHGCNAQGSARPALDAMRESARAAGRDTIAIVEGGAEATHADAEGDDSDPFARVACGTPRPGPVARLRDAARRWLDALALPPP